MFLLNTLDRTRGRISARMLRLLRRTWRAEVHGRQNLDQVVRSGERFILCFWHGKYVPILPALRGLDGFVITSAGRSGEVITGFVGDFGFGCTQIPARGGEGTLHLIEAGLSRFRAVGIAVDGPLGPYHRVKHGAVKVASRLGCRLVPVSVGVVGKYVLKDRWDRFEIPLPFARVCLVIGRPMEVAPALGPQEVTACSGHLGRTLESLDARAALLLARK